MCHEIIGFIKLIKMVKGKIGREKGEVRVELGGMWVEEVRI